MSNKVTCEIFVAMHEDGGWIVTNDESDAASKLFEDEGGYHCRVVKIIVKMAPPVMAEATVEVPDDAGRFWRRAPHRRNNCGCWSNTSAPTRLRSGSW
jgi:hypothetical protein